MGELGDRPPRTDRDGNDAARADRAAVLDEVAVLYDAYPVGRYPGIPRELWERLNDACPELGELRRTCQESVDRDIRAYEAAGPGRDPVSEETRRAGLAYQAALIALLEERGSVRDYTESPVTTAVTVRSISSAVVSGYLTAYFGSQLALQPSATEGSDYECLKCLESIAIGVCGVGVPEGPDGRGTATIGARVEQFLALPEMRGWLKHTTVTEWLDDRKA